MRRALLVAAALMAAALLGRLSASGTGAVDGGGATDHKVVAGVEVGYPHTRAGAELAAAGYQQAFGDTAVLSPALLRRRVAAIATADFAPQMIAANAPGAARLAAGALGRGLATGIPTTFFAVPVARRLISYSPDRARILTWGFTVLGNAASLEPRAYFGTARTDLVWLGGRWRIATNRAAFGPTPALASPRHGGEDFDVIDLTRELRPYGIAP
jgi:hypothetical protein